MSDPSLEDRCTYSFDPSVWEAETGIESPLVADDLDAEGVWRCPHEREPEQNRCLFHLPPDQKDDEAVRDRFLMQIKESGQTPKQFIGARFGRLNLAHAIIESADNHPIDLRHARFADETTWKYAIVRQPLQLDGAIFEEAAYFTETEFENEVYFTKAGFQDRARFIEARFAQGGWFYKTKFTEADFSRSTFDGPADFIHAHFGRVHFREAVFRRRVDFKMVTFDHAMFQAVKFDAGAYFDEAAFPERANFRQTTFEDLVSFEALRIPEATCCIDLQRATIASGRLHQPTDGTIVYDVTDGEIGDISLAAGAMADDLFTHFRFLNTTFDGFDFGTYRDALHRADWTIHEVKQVPGLERDEDPPSAGALENTYLKAKNGANTIGDTKAAAEFFRKEMLYRRYQYLPQARDADRGWRDRLTAAGRWGANLLLDLTAGYGERPSRVIEISVGIILLFGGLFAITQSDPPYDTPIGYLILSLESFITLVLGGAENIPNPWIRLLAQVEGFIGAFLIALFVFTLTRSIHR